MTAVADPALGFWLRHVAAAGGIWEPDGDATYVVLPPPLRVAYQLPEELRVTADPDVAREDGATLLAAGHPVLAEAAERVLACGDTGHLVLARPASAPPGRDVPRTGSRRRRSAGWTCRPGASCPRIWSACCAGRKSTTGPGPNGRRA
jgi:hypothetical protein